MFNPVAWIRHARLFRFGKAEDLRKLGLKNGLRQLTSDQIRAVLNWPHPMVLDTYNYENGHFCPLAVGIGLPATMKDPTHEKVERALLVRGYRIYNTRGVRGSFYTDQRDRDLRIAAREVLAEREISRKGEHVSRNPR